MIAALVISKHKQTADADAYRPPNVIFGNLFHQVSFKVTLRRNMSAEGNQRGRHIRTEEEREALRAATRQRVQRHRARLREEELEARRTEDRQRQQQSRAEMSQEQQAAVRAENRERDMA